jgi:hypothetical protein
MSIQWGDILFDGPTSITLWEPPYRPALYAIMMKPDSRNKPREYETLYFGESGNLSERGFLQSHHKYPCWIKLAGSVNNLYIGIYPMPNSTNEGRKKLEAALIDTYDPICNK